MATARKATVTLGGIPLAGVGAIAWKFQTGTQPYVTVFSVHNDTWERDMKALIGEPIPLVVKDSRGVTTTVKDLFILHTVPSDGPKRTSFAVADRRWMWAYKLIARDYNIAKKTGDRTAVNSVPIENQITVDEYDYRPYSLDGESRWTPETAIEDLLEILEKKSEGGKFIIESLPIELDLTGSGDDGQFRLQNIILRDQGDVAMARLLSYIPGAAVYVDSDGFVRVFDGSDLDQLDVFLKNQPPATWDGEKLANVDRKFIRPSEVRVHYQREVEAVLEYEDDYSGATRAAPIPERPYIDNVIPTVDPSTEVTEFDPVKRKDVTKDVPPGTYVKVEDWLDAMDADKPAGSLPWTFETIKRHWFKGDLEAVLGGSASKGIDLDPQANVAMRVQALRQHFRQTFRINRGYVERLRDIQAIRVALLDPVTGARAPAGVWGQACAVPSNKAKISSREDENLSGIFRNLNSLPASGAKIIETPPGPARVNILDRDLGVFRIQWIASPYGLVDSFVPCFLVGEGGSVSVPKRNLALQDTQPVGGPGTRVEGGTNGIFLSDTLEYKIMVTIVPSAPNNKRQFHVETVQASDIAKVFRTEFRIQGGKGPVLDVFVPPGEATARFAWDDDNIAPVTIGRLLGLDNPDDPTKAGIDQDFLDGYILANQKRELTGHAKAVAAEMLASFADSLMGRMATVAPSSADALKLRGNMAGVTLQVASAPSAKVNVVSEFPGQQKPISRLALMPESTRHVILGIVPFGRGDS